MVNNLICMITRKTKELSVHFGLTFTRSMNGVKLGCQATLLAKVLRSLLL